MVRHRCVNDKSFKCRNLDNEVVVVKPHWKSVGGSAGKRISFRNRFVDISVDGLKVVVKSIGRGKEVKCPISWHCVSLNRDIFVSGDAFPGGDSGFLCDCGKWVNGVDSGHTNVKFGVRVAI